MADLVPTPPRADDVRGVLAGVLDPELRASIVDLGMVHDITVDPDGNVTVKVALTTAACPLRGQIGNDVSSKVAGIPGVANVTVEYAEMTQDERSAVMQRARLHASRQAPPTEVSPTTRVIAVGSGKGGVGKSSITANLAAALAARGFTVGVLDADIWGFSIPRMLGVKARLAGTKQADGKGKILPNEVEVPRDRLQGEGPGGRLKIVSMGLLVDNEDTALMWRGLVLAKALEQFLVDVKWGDLDYLLIDMPPGTGDIQMALARLLPQAEMLVITTPAKGAEKVAARVADMARRSYLKVLGVVENMHEFIAPDGSRHAIFGSGGGKRLAALTGAPLVGEVPIDGAVSEGGDIGLPVVLAHPDLPAAIALNDIARRIVEELLPPVEMAGCTARIFDLVNKLAPRTRTAERVAGDFPREQALVFGEIADQYEAARPSYPDGVFDTIIEYGDLRAGDRALEIGAGTGKATDRFVERGISVHALEPSGEMARVLSAKGVTVEVTSFETWPVHAGAFRLAFAAQAWHWVHGADRYEKAAAALEPGGTLAVFWNIGRAHPEPFKTDNDAVYRRLAPELTDSIGDRWKPEVLLGDAAGCDAFEPMVERKVTWHTSYTSSEWMRLLGTHSGHRMLPDETRTRLHGEIGATIDAHGGLLPVVYDTMIYLARRR